MKYLIWLLMLAMAGFFIYNHFFKSASAEEEGVKQVEKVFDQAVDRYITSMREVGEPGLAVIADLNSPLKKSKRSA